MMGSKEDIELRQKSVRVVYDGIRLEESLRAMTA
jgi:hypothetical protein